MYKHETIEYEKDVPIKIRIQRLENTTRHWHGSMEIYLVLSGDLSVILETDTYHLKEDDILLINSNQLHEIRSNNNVTAVLQIKHSYFKKWMNESTYFQCNSSVYHNKSRFLELKKIIAQLIYLNYNIIDCDDLLCISHSYHLLYELVKNFKSTGTKPAGKKSKNLKRLKGIIEYLNDNYTENITLHSVAEREYLSASYLSHFFEKNMGVSFFNFLTGIRMNHAVYDLINTNLTIEQIAANNGFANSRYFVSRFKKEYGMLPKQYQKEYRKENKNKGAKAQKDYLFIEQHDFLNKLGEYLDTGNYAKNQNPEPSSLLNILDVNAKNQKGTLYHTFKVFTGVGRAKEILMRRIQAELITLQKEIGFRYIKFHGILDDSMMLYNEDKQGNPCLTFHYVDEVLDFLLSIGLKPLIQFSFMPKLLAKDPKSTIFYNPVILSEPNHYGKWAYTIRELTRHIIMRYGLCEVRTWLFTFWNSPYKPYAFAFEKDEIAYELYRITRNSVKECDSLLRFGSPSYGSLSFSGSEFYDFLNYCKTNSCYPDFYNIHCYPVKTSTTKDLATLGESSGESGENDRIILSDDPDYIAHTLECYKKNIARYPKLPTYITEWSSTSSHRDWLNDTCYRSAYIVKNILENYDAVDSFGNWCLSDTMEELPLSNEEFHGELGLFTCNGIKKPAYYAFTFLNKLMDTLVEKGDGYFVTTNQRDDYAIILYNYSHVSPLYAQGILFNVSFMERYNAIIDSNSLEFDFVLSHMENGNYILTEQIVNREQGSAFDEWVRMGALPLNTEEEIGLLKGRSMPKLNKVHMEVTNNSLNYYANLKPHEIRLILINKQPWSEQTQDGNKLQGQGLT